MKSKRFFMAIAMMLILSLILMPMTVSADPTGRFGPRMNAAADTWDRSEGDAVHAIDRDPGTLWHSMWNEDAAINHPEFPTEFASQQDVFPQIWIVEFDAAYKLDRIGYLPRENAFNGTMTVGEYWISTTGSLEDFHTDDGWTKLADFNYGEDDWGGVAHFVYTDFDEVEAKLIKLKVLDGMGGWASIAEIQFGFTNVPYIPFAGFTAEETFQPRTTPMYMQPELRITSGKSTIKATDFDNDNYGKSGADGNQDIRVGHDVRTEVGGSAFGGNIGWIGAGDWVQYTVNVASAGKFDFKAWAASDSDATGGVKILVGDTEVGQSDPVAKAGWQEYDLYDVGTVELAAGETVIRVEFPDGGLNFAALEITPFVEPATEPPATEPPPVEVDDVQTGDDETADNAAADDSAADNSVIGSADDDGGDMTMIIIIVAVVAVIAVVIIVVMAKKKKA